MTGVVLSTVLLCDPEGQEAEATGKIKVNKQVMLFIALFSLPDYSDRLTFLISDKCYLIELT